MFAEFEKIIHAIEESGDALTLDIFKFQYHKLLETYCAENFVLDPELDLECLRIPHFYHAFYVYKYATGVSAAVALSERVLSGETGRVDAYLNFLRSGGSKFPLETLKAAGVDMATPAPIESALRLFERRVTELESLLL
jgi:oligoendopeptidase F